jgi:hypothetical protein
MLTPPEALTCKSPNRATSTTAGNPVARKEELKAQADLNAYLLLHNVLVHELKLVAEALPREYEPPS